MSNSQSEVSHATASSAVGKGFRLLRAEPALLPTELLWRWSFGLGLLGVLFFAYARLRQTVLLLDADSPMLNPRDPWALAQLIASAVAASLPELLRLAAQCSAGLAVLWVATSTLGRGIITRIMVRRYATDSGVAVAPDRPRWATFAVLRCAQVLMLLILVIGYLTGVFLAEFLTSSSGPRPVASALAVLVSLGVSTFVWGYVNQVLALAHLFVARDGLGVLDAIAQAIGFTRRQAVSLFSISVWSATARCVVVVVLTVAGVATLWLAGRLPAVVVGGLLLLQTLVYLVVSDWLLLARLGANVSVALDERAHALANSGAASAGCALQPAPDSANL